MNLEHPDLHLPEQAMRWFGPTDPVPLAHIRQAGAAAVFTSLHEIPYGDLWPREAIRERRELLAAAGLGWAVVESLPVHEAIKTGQGDLKPLFHNYRESLRNLAAEGLTTVVYNFMPVLDWVRTNMRYRLPTGAECVMFDPVHWAAFELHALQRPGAEADFSPEQIEQAGRWWRAQDDTARATFIRQIIDVFPGVKWGFTLDDIRERLARFAGVDAKVLADNLQRFLAEVVPTAAEVGVRLAIHPDDPPFPVLGLPRIVSTEAHLQAILAMVDDPANGLCFCAGSLSARADNDLSGMVSRLASRIHAVHLRSTGRLPGGAFFEADHLAGSVDMPAVVRALLDEQERRRRDGMREWRLAFRPDHGHAMLGDLNHQADVTPGYTVIGRLRGLAELRGLMLGLRHAQLTA